MLVDKDFPAVFESQMMQHKEYEFKRELLKLS